MPELQKLPVPPEKPAITSAPESKQLTTTIPAPLQSRAVVQYFVQAEAVIPVVAPLPTVEIAHLPANAYSAETPVVIVPETLDDMATPILLERTTHYAQASAEQPTYIAEAAMPPIPFVAEYPPAADISVVAEYAADPQSETIPQAPEMPSPPDAQPLSNIIGTLETTLSIGQEGVPAHQEFAQALLALAGAPEVSTVETPQMAEGIDALAEPLVQPPETPLIVAVVAECLISLEPAGQQAAAPILEDIFAVVQRLHALKLDTQPPQPEMSGELYDEAIPHSASQLMYAPLPELFATPVAAESGLPPIASAEARLEELCITLFESLSIQYQEQDIKDFVRALLRPAFRPASTEHAIQHRILLDREGSHEAKQRLRLFGKLSDTYVKDPTEHILGGVALFHFSAMPFQYALAA